MRPLSASAILQAWERGQRRDPLGQALALLSAATPEVTPEEMVALSVGRRDALLLHLHELTFGADLNAVAACPRCGAALEFTLDAHELAAGGGENGRREHSLSAEGYEVRFRLPDSRDLAAMGQTASVEQAMATLLARCVLDARRGGVPVAPGELPAGVVEALSAAMEERDPLADLPLDIDCARCGNRWLAVLDIGTFLWSEIEALAERLLYEIHTLARAYGWSEAEVLALSAARRQYYLDLIPAT